MKTLTFKFVILTIIVAQSTALFAQRKHFGNKPKNKFYFGVEGLMGTRSFKIHSDITAIDKTGAFFTGKGFGVMAGDKAFHAKVTRSYYNTEPMADHKFKLIITEGLVNMYPLQLAKKKFRYFEPYLLAGISRGNLNFYGDYGSALNKKNNNKATVGKPKTGNQFGALNNCSCSCGPMGDPDLYMTSPDAHAPSSSGPSYSTAPAPGDPFAGDPDKPTTEQQTSSSYLGKITINRATIGGGVECHIPGASKFVNLFAEVKYGIPLNSTTKNSLFENTKVSSQLTVNFGINFGLSR